jgi:hypothetical protein
MGKRRGEIKVPVDADNLLITDIVPKKTPYLADASQK